MTAMDIPPFLNQHDTPLPCRFDPEIFFPAKDDGSGSEEARRICWRCPAFDACRAYGLAHPEIAGVWGGLSRRQRRTKAKAAA